MRSTKEGDSKERALPQVKIVMLGNSAVGKTALVQRFSKDEFSDTYAATLGATFTAKNVSLGESTSKVRLMIWDTAGQERYQSMAAMYYQNAMAAVLVYDITNSTTFKGIEYWMQELKQNAPSNIRIVIVGNKADLADQQAVSGEDARAYADRNDVPLMFTSAKNGNGVSELFLRLAKQVLSVSLVF